jgi:hypothetical protein
MCIKKYTFFDSAPGGGIAPGESGRVSCPSSRKIKKDTPFEKNLIKIEISIDK